VAERLLGRLACPKCELNFHRSLPGAQPASPGLCDGYQGPLSPRLDDPEATIARRLDSFDAKTKLVVDKPRVLTLCCRGCPCSPEASQATRRAMASEIRFEIRLLSFSPPTAVSPSVTQLLYLLQSSGCRFSFSIITVVSPSVARLSYLLSQSSLFKSYSPLGTKAPGYKERQTRGRIISERGGLCMCLRALVQLCQAGVG
jgi:hypothetical protein